LNLPWTHAQQNKKFWLESHNSPKTPGQIRKKQQEVGIFSAIFHEG